MEKEDKQYINFSELIKLTNPAKINCRITDFGLVLKQILLVIRN